MMKHSRILTAGPLLAAFPLLATPGAATDLFVEAFNSQGEAKLSVNKAAGGIVEYVDYSSLTVGAKTHTIPEAPRQIAGSAPTKGALLRVDYLTAGNTRHLNLIAQDDVGGSQLNFTNNYRLKFDFYLRLSPDVTLNANGLPTNTGTTEQMLWGVGYTGSLPVARIFRGTQGNGVWGWVSTEGGHGSTGGGDVSIYTGTTEAGARNMDKLTGAADVAAYFAPAFGADASPVPNCPANQWVEATITVRAGLVTVEYGAVGRTVTKFYENVPGNVAGGVLVGYEDSFNSISFDPDNQWMLVDNMVVEDITPPTMLVGAGNGGAQFPTYTGTPVTGSWDVSNLRTDGSLTISRIDLSGVNAADFSVVTPLPLVIAPGTSAPITLRFEPAGANGIRTASATLVSDDPQSPSYTIADIRARRSVGSFLEAHYKLEETTGTTLADASGSGAPGALQVREAVVFGKPSLLGAPDAGAAMGFLPAQTGTTGNYITSSVVHTPTFSISFWMKPAAAGTVRQLFQRDPDFDSTSDEICGLQISPASTLKFRVRNADILESPADAPITDDTVYHVVLTHLDEDGFGNSTATRSRLYIDGRDVDTKAGGATRGFDDYSFSPIASGLHIGSRTTAGAGFAGDLDDIQIYGVELTREQVWELYHRRGAAATPEFSIVTAEYAGAPRAFSATVPSAPQGSYRLFRSADLNVWTAVGDFTAGTPDAIFTTLTDEAPPPGLQYYRVARE